jgi:hypothetical protein
MTVQGEQCPLCKKDRADCTCDAPKDNVDTRPTEAGSERKMFHIKRRVLPKTVVGENECRICGMALEDSVCPMCGWSPKEWEGEVSYRCPFCGSAIEEGKACESCGRTMEDLEKEDYQEFKTPIDFSCPICLKKITLTDDSCPQCSAHIWLDVEGELENLDVLRCPKCRFEISEDDKSCPNCSFDIWIGGEEEMAGAVQNVIGEAENAVNEGLNEGVNLDKYNSLLSETRKKFEEGHHRKAEKMAELVLAATKTTVLQFKMFNDALRKAERLYNEVKDVTDASEVFSVLDQARALADEGEYKNAMRTALRAAIIAEKLKGKQILGLTKNNK